MILLSLCSSHPCPTTGILTAPTKRTHSPQLLYKLWTCSGTWWKPPPPPCRCSTKEASWKLSPDLLPLTSITLRFFKLPSPASPLPPSPTPQQSKLSKVKFKTSCSSVPTAHHYLQEPPPPSSLSTCMAMQSSPLLLLLPFSRCPLLLFHQILAPLWPPLPRLGARRKMTMVGWKLWKTKLKTEEKRRASKLLKTSWPPSTPPWSSLLTSLVLVTRRMVMTGMMRILRMILRMKKKWKEIKIEKLKQTQCWLKPLYRKVFPKEWPHWQATFQTKPDSP